MCDIDVLMAMSFAGPLRFGLKTNPCLMLCLKESQSTMCSLFKSFTAQLDRLTTYVVYNALVLVFWLINGLFGQMGPLVAELCVEGGSGGPEAKQLINNVVAFNSQTREATLNELIIEVSGRMSVMYLRFHTQVRLTSLLLLLLLLLLFGSPF